ncbi:MAG: alpha/beta hydrolase [Acidimicrobiales bacterium]
MAGHVLSVGLPDRYETAQSRYPVVYALDAQWTFGVLYDAATALRLGRHIPPVVVVGVGYDTTSAREALALRARDYLPTVAPFPAGSAPGDVERYGPGQANAFLARLREEIIPWVQDRYRVEPAYSVLAGHSFSALFGLYALFTEPTTCARYLLASPSIWWDDRTILRTEEAWAQASRDLPARVHLLVGGLETVLAPPGAQRSMRDNVRELAERLRSRRYPRLQLDLDVIDGETHHSVIPAALSRGLRVLFQ